VRSDANGAFVYVVGDAGAARRTAVELGVAETGWVEIASGLGGGERVVTGAAPTLADGTAVRVAP
jgi:multidrug efflux pump subunit AcrA (membrane-fusion protein)